MISKIRRSAEKTHIHNLFIFNKTGICLFRVNFTNSYNIKQDQLISSFFTALMAFTKELIGNKIKCIEMGDVKFVVIERGFFYYTLLVDSLENLIFLEDIITKIHNQFLKYVKDNNININLECIFDDGLNRIFNDILYHTFSNEFDLKKEDKIINYIGDLSYTDEIEGVILLTDKGKVVYSSIKRLELSNFLKEVDFRVKICNNSILKMFYTSKNKELIFSEYVEDLYFIILVFDLNTKFGIAEYYLMKVVNFIKTTLKK